MEFKIINMYGREVAIRNITLKKGDRKFRKCPDCGDPSKFIVVELGNPLKRPQPRVWGYCGSCNIGG